MSCVLFGKVCIFACWILVVAVLGKMLCVSLLCVVGVCMLLIVCALDGPGL